MAMVLGGGGTLKVVVTTDLALSKPVTT